MSLYNQDIQGNLNVSRNLNAGSHADIRGDVNIGHHLVVKGWVDAPHIKGPLKGLYANEERLKEAYPSPQPGWFALVGDTLPADVWRAEYDEKTRRNEWKATGEKGGESTLWLDQLEGDVRDLRDDVDDLKELTAGGILMTTGVEFETTSDTASLRLTFLMPDGKPESYPYPIPIVTAEKAGMMSAADKEELTEATGDIRELNIKIRDINIRIGDLTERTKTLEEGLEDLQGKHEATDANLAQLRKEFDALVGENASDAIDNFNEICAFLEGIKDSETLAGKMTALREECRRNRDEVEENLGISEYPEFDEHSSYRAGEVVRYEDGKLYRFIVAHRAGEWNGEEVEEWNIVKDWRENHSRIFDCGGAMSRYGGSRSIDCKGAY